MKTPFHKGKKLVSPLRAILDRCIIWPIPAPDKIGSIILTDTTKNRANPYKGEGILLSVGPGYKSNDGKWHPTSELLKPGVKVKYDHSVPWFTVEKGNDRKKHVLVICGVMDIHGVIND